MKMTDYGHASNNPRGNLGVGRSLAITEICSKKQVVEKENIDSI